MQRKSTPTALNKAVANQLAIAINSGFNPTSASIEFSNTLPKTDSDLQFDRLLTENEAANFLDVKVCTLQGRRSTGRYALPYVKVGRNVRYVQSNLIHWLSARTQHTENLSTDFESGAQT